MGKQSLKQAVKLVRTGKGLHGVTRCGLDGCPVGGWPETQQALHCMVDELPHREERSYTVHDLIAELYDVDHADRYRYRASERLEKAGC